MTDLTRSNSDATSADPQSVVTGELVISIMPRGWIEYTGTRQQLIDEGVMSASDEWEHNADWVTGQYTYWLSRVKERNRYLPDRWCLRIRHVSVRGDGFRAASLFEAEQRVRDLKFWHSRIGAMQLAIAVRAKYDVEFQRFKESLGIVRKKRRRSSEI